MVGKTKYTVGTQFWGQRRM